MRSVTPAYVSFLTQRALWYFRMIEINVRNVSPYKQVCYIQTYFPDGTVLRGSGTVVGANDVLTALHVVYDAKYGGWAKKIVVTPAADVDDHTGAFSAELGTYGASRVIGYSGNWDTDGNGSPSPEESGHDLALIGLEVNLGNVTGSLGYSSSTASGFSGTMLGYPASGTGLMMERGDSTYFSRYPLYEVDGGLGSGASGGPLLDANGQIRGVLSAGDANDTFSWYAALTGDNATWLNQQLTANDDLLADSIYRPTGAGVSSGTTLGDVFFEYQLGFNRKVTQLYGYQDADSLIMSGNYGSYTLTTQATDGSLKVFNKVTGNTSYLHDINALFFNDKTLFVLTEDQAQIARLYTVFNRTPDYQGLANWINAYDHGMTFKQIANSFSQSQEFAIKYNAVDNTGFINQLYNTILGRTADSAGVANWKNALDHGMGRGEAMIEFTNSAENKIRTEGSSGFVQIANHSAWTDADISIIKGVVFGSSYADGIAENQLVLDGNQSTVLGGGGVDTLYFTGTSQSYQRSTDSASDNKVYVNTVSGSERLELHDMNVLSFQDKNVFILDADQAQIARLYTVFGRNPDVQGLQNWFQAEKNGMAFHDIADSFSRSQEFANRYNAVDNLGFAKQLYSTILGREGEAAGLANWKAQLDNGLSRGDAMIAFTDSQENHNRTEGQDGFIQLVGNSDWV